MTIKPPGQVVGPVKGHKACEVPGSQGLLSKCCNFPLLSCPYSLNSPLLPLLKELKKAFENDYTIANLFAYRLIFQKSVKHFARGFSLSSLVLTVIYLKLLNQCILVCMCDYNQPVAWVQPAFQCGLNGHKWSVSTTQEASPRANAGFCICISIKLRCFAY